MELNPLWEWVAPGIEGLGEFAPSAALVVAAAAAWAAVRTLRLRNRVDHADQWWKSVEYAIKLLDSGNQTLYATGKGLLKVQAGTAPPELALTLDEVEPGIFVVLESSGVQLSKPLPMSRLRSLAKDAEFVAVLNRRLKMPNENYIDGLLQLRPQLEYRRAS